jgi:hypothetical protein
MNLGVPSISYEQNERNNEVIIGKTVKRKKSKRKGSDNVNSEISLPPNDDFAFFAFIGLFLVKVIFPSLSINFLVGYLSPFENHILRILGNVNNVLERLHYRTVNVVTTGHFLKTVNPAPGLFENV